MDERWAEMKPGRSRRTDAPEPVETKTGGIDAFPRNGVAGPGCQAATVADGRREKETEAPRWRKCASWMQGGPKNGITKARHRRVAGWRPDEGREGKFITTRVFHSSIKYPSNKTGLSQTLLQSHLSTFRRIIFPLFDPFQQVPSK